MELLTEGQKLTLFFQKDALMVEIVCKIQKVYDDRLDVLLPPYFMRYIEFLQVGKKITVKVFSKHGTIDFNSIVIASPLEDSFLIELDYNSVKLTPSSEIETVSAIENLELNDGKTFHILKTFELAPEFLKFTSDLKFKVNDNFIGSLNLPDDYGIIDFKGVITAIDPIYDNEYTLTFLTMSEDARQSLLYYIYRYDKDIN